MAKSLHYKNVLFLTTCSALKLQFPLESVPNVNYINAYLDLIHGLGYIDPFDGSLSAELFYNQPLLLKT